MSQSILRVVLLGVFVVSGPAAFAKGGKNQQNHHCEKDGAELAGKTKKECKKEGGKWEKNAAEGADAKPAGGDAKPAEDAKPAK